MPEVSGSPTTFYPSRSTYHETFARMVPSSAQEANAITAEMHALGLTKLYVADDGTPGGYPSHFGDLELTVARFDGPLTGPLIHRYLQLAGVR